MTVYLHNLLHFLFGIVCLGVFARIIVVIRLMMLING